MKKLSILALDIATKTGWAHSCGKSGMWNMALKQDESSDMRLLQLERNLEGIVDLYGIHVVVFEAQRGGMPERLGALVKQAEMQGVMKAWCSRLHITYHGYSPGEIKKHATGKGNANKDMMVTAAETRWPDLKIIDDNHADALWILDLAMNRLGQV